MRLSSLQVGAIFLVALMACGHRSATAPTPIGTQPGSSLDPLRDAAASSGKLVGTAIQAAFLSDGRYTAVFNRHFNYVTAEYEMKWDPIEHTRGVENFSGGDMIAAYATGQGMKVKGHTLVWHGSVPGWANGLAPAEFRTAFESHIRSVASHYRGQVIAWDVVNEAIADDGSGLRDTVFRQKLGDSYIADAFRLARGADPQALLFYNDYSGEGSGPKSDRIYDLVRDLKMQGVPIDGVGLQMHVTAAGAPSEGSISANMRRLADLGLLVNISEMDVRIKDVPGTAQARLDVQKSVYHSIVGTCVAEPRCHGVTFWGFTDAHTWIDSQYGSGDAPLLFDTQYAAKPAYFGVLDAFRHR